MVGEKVWLLLVYFLLHWSKHATAETLLPSSEILNLNTGSSTWKRDLEVSRVSILTKRASPRAATTRRQDQGLTRSHSAPPSLAGQSALAGHLLAEDEGTSRRRTNASQSRPTAMPGTDNRRPRQWQPDRLITTTAGPSRSMISADRGRPSLHSNQGRRRYTDLVRSVSPPRLRQDQVPPRASSSSPTWRRRINNVSNRFAHPQYPDPAVATIGMVGPGVILQQTPNNRQYQTVVPAHSTAIRYTDHPVLSIIGGETMTHGRMMASSSGAQVMSGLTTAKGHGFLTIHMGSGTETQWHGNHSRDGGWARQRTVGSQPPKTLAHVLGQGEITALACNDPSWCDDLWHSDRFRES